MPPLDGEKPARPLSAGRLGASMIKLDTSIAENQSDIGSESNGPTPNFVTYDGEGNMIEAGQAAPPMAGGFQLPPNPPSRSSHNWSLAGLSIPTRLSFRNIDQSISLADVDQHRPSSPVMRETRLPPGPTIMASSPSDLAARKRAMNQQLAAAGEPRPGSEPQLGDPRIPRMIPVIHGEQSIEDITWDTPRGYDDFIQAIATPVHEDDHWPKKNSMRNNVIVACLLAMAAGAFVFSLTFLLLSDRKGSQPVYVQTGGEPTMDSSDGVPIFMNPFVTLEYISVQDVPINESALVDLAQAHIGDHFEALLVGYLSLNVGIVFDAGNTRTSQGEVKMIVCEALINFEEGKVPKEETIQSALKVAFGTTGMPEFANDMKLIGMPLASLVIYAEDGSVLGSARLQPSASPTLPPTMPVNYVAPPTNFPSSVPTTTPTTIPTSQPSRPSKVPTTTPSGKPTQAPIIAATPNPTSTPFNSPTSFPTPTPTKEPTNTPSTSPTEGPGDQKPPTASPTPVFDDCAEQTLSTRMNGDTFIAGAAFDITAGNQTLSLTGISLRIDSNETDIPVRLWTKEGSHIGYENSPSFWTMLDRGLIRRGRGIDKKSVVRMPQTIDVKAHSTVGIFVRVPDGTNIIFTDQYKEFGNDVLTLSNFIGKSGLPFDGPIYRDFFPNAAVKYEFKACA